MDCIFCAIASRKVQSIIIYEDEKVLAVLDIYPAVPGQIIIFPRRHVKYLWELELEEQIRLFSLISILSKTLKETLNANGISIYIPQDKIAGQNFDHLYLYLIPRYDKDDVKIEWQRKQIDPTVLKEISEKILSKIKTIQIPIESKVKEEKKVVKEPKSEREDQTKKYIWYIKKP